MAKPADFRRGAPFRRLLGVLLLALVAACAHVGPSGPSPRFDGLYVSDERATPTRRSYIRFYPDGTVVMASVTDPSTPQQVAGWLSPTHAWSASGAYDVRSSRIFLSVRARTPATDGGGAGSVANSYQGLIRGDSILLDRDGGGISVVTYRFADVAFEQ